MGRYRRVTNTLSSSFSQQYIHDTFLRLMDVLRKLKNSFYDLIACQLPNSWELLSMSRSYIFCFRSFRIISLVLSIIFIFFLRLLTLSHFLKYRLRLSWRLCIVLGPFHHFHNDSSPSLAESSRQKELEHFLVLSTRSRLALRYLSPILDHFD